VIAWRALCIATCGVLALRGARPVAAQEIPQLRGYRLGASFQDTRASRLPCQPIEKRLRCDRPDSVWLFFEHDTLTAISVNFPLRPVAARARWFAVADSLIELYGEPDSVAVADQVVAPGFITTPRASWLHLTAARPWGAVYGVFEVHAPDHVASSASLDLSACFWPDQGPRCAMLLKPARKPTDH